MPGSAALATEGFFPGSNANYSQAFNPATIGATPVNYYATSWLDGVLLRATGA